MEAVRLPLDMRQEFSERQQQLILVRRILNVDHAELVRRLSVYYAEPLEPTHLARMENGFVPIPVALSTAILRLINERLDAMFLLLAKIRQARRDPNWPYPTPAHERSGG